MRAEKRAGADRYGAPLEPQTAGHSRNFSPRALGCWRLASTATGGRVANQTFKGASRHARRGLAARLFDSVQVRPPRTAAGRHHAGAGGTP